MYAPYEVLPYSHDALSLLIQRVTGTSFHRVRQKRQISYLDHYITHWQRRENPNRTIQMIVENHYIDQHFIEDFAQYYVRCFHPYPRECVRVHFFLSNLVQEQNDLGNKKPVLDELCFRNILEGKNSDGVNQDLLRKDYLGFVVIRPIPETFLAKVCLRLYSNLMAGKTNGCTVLTIENKVSLFGISLQVDSVPFQEQDRVLSACATSAIWSFFYAHKCVSRVNLPSPITITKSAYPSNNGMDVRFPNLGLSPDMMCRSIRNQGLEPSIIGLTDSAAARLCLRIRRRLRSIIGLTDFSATRQLLEHVYAYVNSGWPVLLGLKVFNEKGEEQGLHAITVLGYKLSEDSVLPLDSDQVRMKAHKIKYLYIHDDRVGPYARLTFDAGRWTIGVEQISNVPTFDTKETYEPTNLILGVYHKQRISYVRIKQTCQNLQDFLLLFCKSDMAGNESERQEMGTAISALEWDIQIENVQSLKQRLLKEDGAVKGKSEIITASLPRFVWSMKARKNEQEIMELLFDATDIPQGHAFLGILYYNRFSESLFCSFKNYCQTGYTKVLNQNEFDRIPSDHLWGIVDFFVRQEDFQKSLDGLFGKLKTPKYVKPMEIEKDGLHYQHPWILFAGDPEVILEETKKYIWVINKSGALVIGHEDNSRGPEFGGHPTLLRGESGRIGGELLFNSQQQCWEVNAKSGRYSYCYSTEESKNYLCQAVEQRFRPFFPNLTFTAL
ncbi:MAG: hypothetical protein WCR04_09585 [Fibrobacteraceae bacterium]